MSRPNRTELLEVAAMKRLKRVRRVIMVGSGKGGVGKSFVSCALALSIGRMGYRTGIFDIDLHGASVPEYFGLTPPLESSDDGLRPKVIDGVRVMSVSLLTGAAAVPVPGRLKESLITQFFGLTSWGTLDYLVVDLPPGSGDEVLTAFRLFSRDSCLVLVSTPSSVALPVVSRLRQLASAEGIKVEGVVLNMAFMGRGRRRTYPFGKPDESSITGELGSPVLAELPLYSGVDGLTTRELFMRAAVYSAFDALARKIAGDF